MRNLNLDQLQSFLKVVEKGSFSAAARALNLTQPAISQQIRELEGRLGVQLIARLGKKALPTEAGKELAHRGKAVLTNAQDAIAAVQRFRDGWIAPIRLGATITVCVYLLPRLLGDLKQSHRDFSVSIEIDLSHVIVEKIVHDDLDVGIVALPLTKPHPVSVIRIREDPVMAIFPLSEGELPEAVTANTLMQHPLLFDLPSTQMYRIVMGWFEAQGMSPKPILHLGNSEALKAMVKAGVGVSVIGIEDDEDLPSRGLAARPLMPPLTRELGLVVHRDKPPHPAVAEIRDRLIALQKPQTS